MREMHFVLVEPKVPENVGAAARALKTMGFGSLRLVNPCDYRCGKARALAHASVDILENAQVHDSVEDAVADSDFTIATTGRQRRLRSDYCNAGDLAALITSKGDTVRSCAVVFGPEERGLRTEEIMLCDATTMIPMAGRYPSLNLAQAVMVYAYSLSSLRIRNRQEPLAPPGDGELRAVREIVRDLLLRIGFKKTQSVYSRILERLGGMSQIDVHLVHSICHKVDKKLKGY